MSVVSDAGRSQSPLVEISIDEASPDISAIYQDIARLSGIPLPALIWRHLATYPSVLPQIWQALRPFYACGAVQDVAWGTVKTVLGGETSGLTTARLIAGGLGDEITNDYRRVLRSYNRANPVNFVGVRLVLAALAGTATPSASSSDAPRLPDWTPPSPIEGLPPMVPVPEITGEVRRKIDSLAAAAGIDRGQVVPSLYRHLVPWPGLIDLLHAELAPRVQSGEIARLSDRIAGALRIEAEALANQMPSLSDLARIEDVKPTLEAFSGLIPEMVVIGTLLEAGVQRRV